MQQLLPMLFSFEGRLRRFHWWMIRLAVFGGGILLAIAVLIPVGVMLRLTDGAAGTGLAFGIFALFMTLILLFLAFLWVWVDLATCAKRLHD